MFGNIGIWQLLIILVIVVLLFGTKRLRNLGGDLGSAMRSFRDAFSGGSEEEKEDLAPDEPDQLTGETRRRTSDSAGTGEQQRERD